MSTPHGEATPAQLAAARVYRVVVADDAAGIRALMRTLLSLEPDFEVVGQASDGAEAVSVVSSVRPDLIVIDVSMPVMSGVEAIEAIRRISPETRVVVLSGERRALPDGAHALIEKGTPNEIVIDRLRGVCRAESA